MAVYKSSDSEVSRILQANSPSCLQLDIWDFKKRLPEAGVETEEDHEMHDGCGHCTEIRTLGAETFDQQNFRSPIISNWGPQFSAKQAHHEI